MAASNVSHMARAQFSHGHNMVASAQNAPVGTFMPGTKVQVGSHRVIIDRYLSEGGFAHVYVVTLPKAVDGQEKGVLKRVAVPDKDHLANMRTEVETMKKLRGHKQIVKYIDSHASSLKNGGYEVFLLMEFCQGGGLIDFMNTRLQHRLTEPEIVNIFTDVAEGVACMHYLKPPLLHRDLKVENVLISTAGKSRMFKLCDFGSAAPPRPAATSAAEGRQIEDDVQRHTTMQYRSPEMIDVYRKQPIDEKSDIWALGVFLYKLCYYTTPFEEVGQTAILNASFKYPGYPRFSDKLKLLIASMLREQPSQRPNIYQVLQKACQMDGRELQIRDIYTDRTRSETQSSDALPQSRSTITKAGAMLSPPVKETSPAIPEIAPMRRGRPSAPVSQHNSARPSPSPLRMIDESDPFAQLDSNRATNGDEISHKFPTLDQFSLMTDKQPKFAFRSEALQQSDPEQSNLSKRVTNALADEAFVSPPALPTKQSNAITRHEAANPASRIKERSTQTDVAVKNGIPPSNARNSNMVSTGTMTSPSPPSMAPLKASERPIYRFPARENTTPTIASSSKTAPTRPPITSSRSGSLLAGLLRDDAARSQSDSEPLNSSSKSPFDKSRQSLAEFDDSSSRSRSLEMRVRPASVNMGSGPTHIKDQGIRKPTAVRRMEFADQDQVDTVTDTNITSDVDFLKAREEAEKEKSKLVKRNSSGSRHSKRASLPSISLSGTKNLFSGRFGDAFKRFESQNDSNREDSSENDPPELLTPIAGSEATDLSDDRHGFEEMQELSPEMRRELEKRQSEAEEKRVANAGAEYRQRTSSRVGPPVSSKAASIQNRVQSLLQETGRPVQKSATGYGHFTESPVEPSPSPAPQKSATFQVSGRTQHLPAANDHLQDQRSASAPAYAANAQRAPRPAAPPKPKTLQIARENDQIAIPAEPSDAFEHTAPRDDWETQFSQRYPSLSHLEMVETEIDAPRSAQLKTKEI